MDTSVATGLNTAEQVWLAIAIVPGSTVAGAAKFIAVEAAAAFVGASFLVSLALATADIAMMTIATIAISMAIASNQNISVCVWLSVVGGLQQHSKEQISLRKVHLWRQLSRASAKISGMVRYIILGIQVISGISPSIVSEGV